MTTTAETIELRGGPVDGQQLAVERGMTVFEMIQPRPIRWDFDPEPTDRVDEPIRLQWIATSRRNREGRRIFEYRKPRP